MSSRFPTYKILSYCFHPIHVKDEVKDIYVPCGKCDGCRLHKANEWSIRLRDEIEATPYSIFFTLTYNNKYLPKLYVIDTVYDNDGTIHFTYSSDHPDNIRHNSKVDVVRKDGILFSSIHAPIKIENLSSWCLNYASKNDIQLWLKLVRKWLIENLHLDENRQDRGLFRYYIISEVGPTTFRNHYHGVIFPKSREIAESLIENGLFENWKMCDKDLFKQYTHYCDSGAAGYVTNYVTGFSSLPEVYKEVKELRPFRLASKAPAIGYINTDETEIFKDLSRGVIEYSRSVKRLGTTSVLKRPKDFMRTLFPKCYEYGLADSARISLVYGRLFRASVQFGYPIDFVRGLLRAFMRNSDYIATCAAYKYITNFGSSLEHYLFLLDNYYYRVGMDALQGHFNEVQRLSNTFDIYKVINYYVNFHEFVSKALQGIGSYPLALWYFLDAFGLSWSASYDFLKKKSYIFKDELFESYKREVKSIIQSAQKTVKYNELSGKKPHIV